MKDHVPSIEVHLKSELAPASSPLASTTKPVRVGNVVIGGPAFALIAGPCSIESREQFFETATAVKKSGAVLLRGGIWKMRTSFQSFQGLGPEAVSFIREVLDYTGLQLVSEITDPRQVELLDPLVGMYQVGARNMYNYALLKELGQTRKPVLLKRGFSALVDEWIKAAEYISMGGNDQIILCERGIRTFETSTRNTFDLNAVLVAKSRTNFPVIVDPSHAVGIREYVPKLALAAAVAGADGLIVEVHPRPADALSDGFQALTILDFQKLSHDLERVLGALDRAILKPV
ncbi:MAG: 3-deoxy-7-phosphoheptulonate synthase [Bdellovibrio sp.]|jgi:3-deoxy-7-phosphoheptulonate synthase